MLAEATELPAQPILPAATEIPSVPRELPATALPTAVSAPPAPVLPTLAPAASAPPEATPAAIPTQAPPLVTIGDASWPVELAHTPGARARGLSGRDVLPEGTGMLFVFDEDQHLTFWMPNMNFPLDMVWIGSKCRVVDVTLNALPQQPGQSLDDLERYSPESPARFVLEINEGEFTGAGLVRNDSVKFGGAIAGQYGC